MDQILCMAGRPYLRNWAQSTVMTLFAVLIWITVSDLHIQWTTSRNQGDTLSCKRPWTLQTSCQRAPWTSPHTCDIACSCLPLRAAFLSSKKWVPPWKSGKYRMQFRFAWLRRERQVCQHLQWLRSGIGLSRIDRQDEVWKRHTSQVPWSKHFFVKIFTMSEKVRGLRLPEVLDGCFIISVWSLSVF